MKELRCFIA